MGNADYRKCAGACGRTYTTPGNFREECKGGGVAADPNWGACWCTQADKAVRKECYEQCAAGSAPKLCPNYHGGGINGWSKCGDIFQDHLDNDDVHYMCSDETPMGNADYRKCAGACGRTFTTPGNFREECKGGGVA